MGQTCNNIREGKNILNNLKKVNTGQSGADVFELNESQILKHVIREKIKNGMFDTYVREALFYQSMCPKAYLPEVSTNEISDDEIILVMKKYRSINRNDFGERLLMEIANVLARIHSEQIPEFLLDSGIKQNVLSEDDIAYCKNGWYSVIDEHPGMFDYSYIDAISSNINDIIRWHNSEIRHLSHGDFHWDNILADDNGSLIVCDWQGVGVRGASEDLSFFISRLSADGIEVDSHRFLACYAGEYNRLTGENIEAAGLEKHIKAANVITTFRYWHMYLHGNDTERVRDIYDRMISDYIEIG